MVLYIDTTSNDEITISLMAGKRSLAEKKISAPRQQAEKLLPAIEQLLKKKKMTLDKISRIKVNNRGGSFTALRIGVVTANALAYALGVPVEGVVGRPKKTAGIAVIRAEYDRNPNIIKKKTKRKLT